MDDTLRTPTKRSELQMTRSMCWHCQSEIKGEYFCEQCVKVQPLSKELDYFSCLGLPRRLQVDPETIETRFYTLSRTFHPDFFHGKTPTEQSISLGNAALLNSAYRTLKDPVRRAEYLVQLEAGSVKDIRATPPADIFEEILSLQDDLEEFKSQAADPTSEDALRLRAKLKEDRGRLEQRQRDMEQQLLSLFATWDSLAARGDDEQTRAQKEQTLQQMRDLLSTRTYLRNIIQDLAATTD